MKSSCLINACAPYLTIFIMLLELFISGTSSQKTVTFKLQDITKYQHRVGNIAEEVNAVPSMYSDVILNPDKYFTSDKSSSLFTKMTIDRDIICHDLGCCQQSQCTIEMEAHLFREGIPEIVKVQVIVQDANDNKPRFEMSQVIPIPESSPSGTSFQLPKATDKDSPHFGVVKYRLDSPNDDGTFSLVQEHNQPILLINKPLDRENVDRYQLTLLAIDGGDPPLTGTTTISIEISDVNDHSPTFVGNGSLSISILEDTRKGTKLKTIQAIDNDAGENAKITYTLGVQSEPNYLALKKFKINPNSGDIVIQEMVDYEETAERKFVLYIIAKDGGSPAFSSTATLSIRVIDVNDNEPELQIRKSNDIEENDSTKDKLVQIITVTDADSTHKTDISCQLKETGDFILKNFSVRMYVLLAARPFDYETEHEIQPVIECLDLAPPAKTIVKTLNVKIIDKNDNYPLFEKKLYQVKVPENTPTNSELITIKATDKDSGEFGKIVYKLIALKDPSFMQYITISQSGRIILLKKLDRERLPRISFKVQATDGGKPSGLRSTTELVLDITDINDNAPRYEGLRHFSVVENPPDGYEVGILPFTDPDAGLNSSIQISLDRTQSFGANWFYVVKDKLFARNIVDRELYSNVTLQVKARDEGSPPQSTKVTITILIQDRNDNSPRLIYPHNNTVIGEDIPVPRNSPRGTLLASLRVQDLDAGENGTVTYRILRSNASRDIFAIGQVDGRLVSDWFDLNQPQPNVYFVSILMLDNGIPRRSNIVHFYVNISSAVYLAAGVDQNLSNVVILILIVVCSMALIVSLVAAIFWVRFRVSRPPRAPPGYAASSQFTKSYCEGTPVHFYQPGEMQPDFNLMDYTNSCTLPRKDSRLQTISRRDDYYQMENIGQATYCPKEMPLPRQAASMQCVQCVTSTSPSDSLVSPSNYTTSTLPPVGPPTAPRIGVPNAAAATYNPHPTIHFHGNGNLTGAGVGVGVGPRGGPKCERRLSDLSYSDSGKGGSLEDLSRFPTSTSTFASPNSANGGGAGGGGAAGGLGGASAIGSVGQNGGGGGGGTLGSKLERIRGLQAANAAAAAAKSANLRNNLEPSNEHAGGEEQHPLRSQQQQQQQLQNNMSISNPTSKCYKNPRANTPETMC